MLFFPFYRAENQKLKRIIDFPKVLQEVSGVLGLNYKVTRFWYGTSVEMDTDVIMGHRGRHNRWEKAAHIKSGEFNGSYYCILLSELFPLLKLELFSWRSKVLEYPLLKKSKSWKQKQATEALRVCMCIVNVYIFTMSIILLSYQSSGMCQVLF